MDKIQLRRQMKKLRRELSPEDKEWMDQHIRKLLLEQLPAPDGAPVICCYVSYGTEPDTHGLLEELWNRGYQVAVPRVEGREMHFFKIEGMGDLEPGSMGILEPVHTCESVSSEAMAGAIVITPGLAFTRSGDRMGYGGGFYDRFFEQYPGCLSMAAAYPFQIIEAIPTEPTDRKVQILITPDAWVDLR